MVMPNFLWLHITKCGGQSFKKTFSHKYIQTNRLYTKPFIAYTKEEYNDVLNNWRIPLGEYDFKRMLFAKKFLYTPEEFQSMNKFVIVRNPYDRAVSIWKYVMKHRTLNPKKLLLKYSFESFLNKIPEYWKIENYRFMINRHIATHTAPIWDDLTDENDNPLVNNIFYLENIHNDIHEINKIVGLNTSNYKHINKTRKNSEYRKYYTKRTKYLVEKLYYKDIEQLGYKF